MAAYAEFASFYDQVMGDRSPVIERVRGYILRYLPGAGSLLELGCGTGAVLAGLAPGLRVTGIDLSPEMLAAAARNAATASLAEADITTFSLGTRFDVVICIFDTLNHLRGGSDQSPATSTAVASFTGNAVVGPAMVRDSGICCHGPPSTRYCAE